MARFVKGDVFVIPFSFSDLSGSKRRPAFVINTLPGNDILLCQITSHYNSEQYEFKVTPVNMLETAKAAFTKQLVLVVPTRAITPQFVTFFLKNVKANLGKTSIKFNVTYTAANLKIGLYTLERGLTINDDIVSWLEEQKDVEVSVICV